MVPFRKQAAEALIASLRLCAENRDMADYWLSLWPGDALPPRSAFNPAKLKKRLPDVILFDVVPERSVTVRLAGTNIVRGLRMELKGRDWIELATPSFRAERLRVFTAIAAGAISTGHRRVPVTHGQHFTTEEILLPFAPDDDGVSTVLCHLHGDAGPYERIEPVSDAVGSPMESTLHPLADTRRAA